MRILASLPVLAICIATATAAMAQAPAAAAPAKPVVKTTCTDYIAMDETIKPRFIYYALGYGKNGKPEAIFDEGAVEKIKPELDRFCSVNLTKSAYEQVMASSMASDPVGRKAQGK